MYNLPANRPPNKNKRCRQRKPGSVVEESLLLQRFFTVCKQGILSSSSSFSSFSWDWLPHIGYLKFVTIIPNRIYANPFRYQGVFYNISPGLAGLRTGSLHYTVCLRIQWSWKYKLLPVSAQHTNETGDPGGLCGRHLWVMARNEHH